MTEKRFGRRISWNDAILGAIGMLIFCTFVIGLLFTIGAMPFSIIVGVVVIMAMVDYFQSIWKTENDA